MLDKKILKIEIVIKIVSWKLEIFRRKFDISVIQFPLNWTQIFCRTMKTLRILIIFAIISILIVTSAVDGGVVKGTNYKITKFKIHKL